MRLEIDTKCHGCTYCDADAVYELLGSLRRDTSVFFCTKHAEQLSDAKPPKPRLDPWIEEDGDGNWYVFSEDGYIAFRGMSSFSRPVAEKLLEAAQMTESIVRGEES